MSAFNGPRPPIESLVEVGFVLEYKHEYMLVDSLNFKGLCWVPSFDYYLPDVDGSSNLSPRLDNFLVLKSIFEFSIIKGEEKEVNRG